MKNLMITAAITLLSASAFADNRIPPTRILEASAAVYKVTEVEKKDGTLETVSTEVCKKPIQIPSFRSNSNADVSYDHDKFTSYCHGQILGQDVTVIFGTIHSSLLIQAGKITKDFGLEPWINSRANLIIGITHVLPGKIEPRYDEVKKEMDWSRGQTDTDYSKWMDILPDAKTSVSVFRGAVDQGFVNLLYLYNYDVCNRISDEVRKKKCTEDGYFRVSITYKGRR